MIGHVRQWPWSRLNHRFVVVCLLLSYLAPCLAKLATAEIGSVTLPAEAEAWLESGAMETTESDRTALDGDARSIRKLLKFMPSMQKVIEEVDEVSVMEQLLKSMEKDKEKIQSRIHAKKMQAKIPVETSKQTYRPSIKDRKKKEPEPEPEPEEEPQDEPGEEEDVGATDEELDANEAKQQLSDGGSGGSSWTGVLSGFFGGKKSAAPAEAEAEAGEEEGGEEEGEGTDSGDEEAPAPAVKRVKRTKPKDPVEYCMGAAAPWDPWAPPGSAPETPQPVGNPSAARLGKRRLLEALLGLEGNRSSTGLGPEGGATWQQRRRRRGMQRRRLQQARGGSIDTRPLKGRCATASSQSKKILASETALANCLRAKGDHCPEDQDAVLAAARALPSMKAIAGNGKVRCLTVHSKGCQSITGNPETAQPARSRSRPPAKSSELPRQFRSCAIVGNGPGLRKHTNGEVIDKHDAVFRFNALSAARPNPTTTGTKTNFRMFNKKRIMTLGRMGFKPQEREVWLSWNYAAIPLLGKLKNLNKELAVLSPEITRYMVNGYFGIRKDMTRLGLGKFGCPTNLNSGVHAIFLAMQMCEHVNLFGFSYSLQMLNSRADAYSPRMSQHHDWGFDTLLLRALFYAGRVNLCSS